MNPLKTNLKSVLSMLVLTQKLLIFERGREREIEIEREKVKKFTSII